MKLELKHIAPYLPYGLRLTNSSHPMNGRMCELLSKYDYNTIRPILRPLSDLIPVEEDDINDMVLINLVNGADQHCDAYDEWRDSYLDNPEQMRILQAPYEVFEELIKQHYDVFGLIPAGLAIDVNTIKP